MDEVTRRNRLDLCTPAERAIYEATYEVEKIGADVRLTEAQNLLDKARNLIADYIDNVPTLSVEKSEGEEAWKVFNRITPLGDTGDNMIDEGITNGDIELLDHFQKSDSEELQSICDKLNATLHSSGDRGRKEWPGQKEMLEFMKEHFWENEEVTQTWDQIVNYTNAVIDWLKTRSGK